MSEPIFSPGLEGIIAGETAVSTIEGGLYYRGYAIEDLAAHSTFEEVAYLLLYCELPNKTESEAFHRRLGEARHVPGEIIQALRSIPPQAPMMDVMRSSASLLAHWDADVTDNSHDANVRKAERLLAQLPVILAARQRLLAGKEPVAPDPARSLAENFLWMLSRRQPSERSV